MMLWPGVALVRAQGNYEIQVYGSDTVPPDRTMVEIHSNFTIQGSTSTEMGYQRRVFSPDTWTWEIRPIIDKQLGPWYLAFNPALERSWHGPSVGQGFAFSPNFKFSYNITRKLQAGLEYYGSMGDITGFDPLYLQQQQFFPSIDYDFGPNLEFNFGVGVGVTRSTDHLLIKAIVGRRFRFITPRLGQAFR